MGNGPANFAWNKAIGELHKAGKIIMAHPVRERGTRDPGG